VCGAGDSFRFSIDRFAGLVAVHAAHGAACDQQREEAEILFAVIVFGTRGGGEQDSLVAGEVAVRGNARGQCPRCLGSHDWIRRQRDRFF
jgi:hypothetical protein